MTDHWSDGVICMPRHEPLVCVRGMRRLKGTDHMKNIVQTGYV